MAEEHEASGEAEDDLHRKYREALERKKGAQHKGSEGSSGKGAVGHAASGSTQRRFQRRAGGS